LIWASTTLGMCAKPRDIQLKSFSDTKERGEKSRREAMKI